jgi:prepilin-type N-terminal cleavage/methylation domain-containing protein
MPKKPAHFSDGFTLIEVIVVVALSVMITLAATSLFMTTLRASNKKVMISRVKDEGDYALSQMEFLLRNAVKLVADPSNPAAPVCSSGSTSISFKSADGGTTTLYATNGTGSVIASKSATLANPVYLTSDAVTLTNLAFTCQQSVGSTGTYVKVSFTLQKDSTEFNEPQPTTQDFATSVSIRNL